MANEKEKPLENTEENDKILSEIVELAKSEGEKMDEEKEKLVAVEDAPADEKKDEPTPAETAEWTPDDAFLERAVKAGLSLGDARAFKDADAAERFVSLLEEKGKGADTPAEKSDDDDEGKDDLPELTDEEKEDLDPSIVKMLEAQSRMLKAAMKEIRTLRDAGRAASERDFFEAQFGGLDEKVRSHTDAAAKQRLKSKFAMLEAGYKATGTKITREDAFKEAVKLVLGDAEAKAAADARAAKVADRRRMALAPSGGTGKAERKTQADIDEEVIAGIGRVLAEMN